MKQIVFGKKQTRSNHFKKTLKSGFFGVTLSGKVFEGAKEMR